MMQKVVFLNLFITLLLGISCQAQYLMHNQQEAYKIQENEKRFINKSLDSLLSAIKPPIKMARAEMTTNSPASGYFVFTFSSFSDSEKKRRTDKEYNPAKIVVYIKEPFKWDPKIGNTADEKLSWTKEDREKYGSLTVIRIWVLGERK